MKSVNLGLENPESILSILEGETRLDIGDSSHADLLIEALKSNQTISDLYISYVADSRLIGETIESVCFLSNIFDHVADNINWIEFHPKSLTLESCNISERMLAIAQSKITKLTLRGCSIAPSVLNPIIESLDLESLRLENIFTIMFDVSDIIDSFHPPLAELSLKDADSSPDFVLYEEMLKRLNLAKFEFGPCEIDDDEVFIRLFDHCKPLELSLYGVDLSNLLERIAGKLENLNFLRLDSCSIGDQNASTLAHLLENGVQFLDLSRNEITAVGMEILANAIVKNYKFHSLDITNNPIGVEGMAQIKFILEKSSIRALILDGFRFNLESVKYLAAGLEKNKSLYSLCVEGCHFPVESIPVLFQSLYHHSYLCGFYFTRMPNWDYIQYLGELLEKNKSLRQIGCPQIYGNSSFDFLVSKMEKNFNLTWIGKPNAQYYDDYHRYSDLNEFSAFVPYTQRNLVLQASRLREFISACRALILLDTSYDLQFLIFQHLFTYAILPQDRFIMTTIMIDRKYIGKIKSKVRFSPQAFSDLVQILYNQ